MKWPLVWRSRLDDLERINDELALGQARLRDAVATMESERDEANERAGRAPLSAQRAEQRAANREAENNQLRMSEGGALEGTDLRTAMRRGDNQKAHEVKFRQLKTNFQEFKRDFMAAVAVIRRITRKEPSKITHDDLAKANELLESFQVYGFNPVGWDDRKVDMLRSVSGRLRSTGVAEDLIAEIDNFLSEIDA